MPIITEKNQGIRLPLASPGPTPLHASRELGGYYKVRSYHGGGEFFQPENAQVILQNLGEFLPRATERLGADGRREIFYQHLVNGEDVSSRTAPLDSGADIPNAEIVRLEAAIALLKAKENDPGTDPTKREMIRAFRLPCPQKDPELYRLYGSGSGRRLLVLWGVEKEAGSSLPPAEAVQRVPQSARSVHRSLLWLIPAVLCLLLLGWWWSAQRPSAGTVEGHSNPPRAAPTLTDKNPVMRTAGDVGPTDSPSGNAPPGVQPAEAPSKAQALTAATLETPAHYTEGIPVSPAGIEGNSASPNSQARQRPVLEGDDPGQRSRPVDNQLPDDPKKFEPDSKEGLSAGKLAAAPQGEPSEQKKDNPSPPPDGAKGDLPARTSVTSRRSTNLPNDPKLQTGHDVAPQADDEKKFGTVSPTPVPASFPDNAADNVSKNREPAEPDEKPRVAGTDRTPSAGGLQDTPTVTPRSAQAIVPSHSKSEEPSSTSTSANPGATGGPGTTRALASGPLSAEIVNARTGTAPKDGKVEMQLSVLARGADGKVVILAKVESWSVDGKTQLDQAGLPFTTNALPVNLTEGTHRVRVNGTAANGSPVSAEADVKVDIAVRQESTVKVKQVLKP